MNLLNLWRLHEGSARISLLEFFCCHKDLSRSLLSWKFDFPLLTAQALSSGQNLKRVPGCFWLLRLLRLFLSASYGCSTSSIVSAASPCLGVLQVEYILANWANEQWCSTSGLCMFLSRMSNELTHSPSTSSMVMIVFSCFFVFGCCLPDPLHFKVFSVQWYPLAANVAVVMVRSGMSF